MHQDLLDLLRAFIDCNVRFMVVGAYALGVHGRPRATGDLDVWVDATPDNAARVMDQYVGGQLTTNMRSRMLICPVTDPPGYTQMSIANRAAP